MGNVQNCNISYTNGIYRVLTFRITGFMDFVHRPDLQVTTKHSVSETRSVSDFRLRERDILLGPNRCFLDPSNSGRGTKPINTVIKAIYTDTDESALRLSIGSGACVANITLNIENR
jgi:hypothetical protein